MCGLDPERFGNRSELVTHLLDAGSEFGRAANIDNLAGRFQSSRNGGIGGDNGLDVGGDALAQRARHSGRTEDADEAVQLV
jgi:hypothetical protein